MLAIFTTSCKDAARNQAQDAVSNYVGKIIVLPDGLQYRNITDTICPPPREGLKLVVYINGECGACAQQLTDWSRFVTEFTKEGDIEVLFYIKAMDSYAIVPHLRRIDFKYPFFIDPKDDLLYLNHISQKTPLLHTFLLDRDNRMVLVGPPLNNPKLMELYKREIRDLSSKNRPPLYP